MSRKPIIAGNWKMNKTVEEALELIDEMIDDLDVFDEVERVICPPFLALYPASELLDETTIWLGAQNMYWEEKGAFTGEISPLMLRELCDFVIIGHSERRTLLGESDTDVNKKVHAAFRHDITPIIAVGENLAQHKAGEAEAVVVRQVKAAFEGVNEADAANAVVAYEPIWAIGTGLAATGEYANNVAGAIRRTLTGLYNEEVAQAIRIQYGGSVNAKNIEEFIQQPEIDGALVGGASLQAEDFIKIVAITANIKGEQ